MHSPSRASRSPLQRVGMVAAGLGAGLLPTCVGALRSEDLARWPYYGWLLLALAAYLSLARSRAQVLLAAAAFALALTGLDLLARALLDDVVYHRPAERFIARWSPMPALARFDADVRFAGTSIGDIAAISERRATSPQRPTTFVTDRLGFRNDPAWVDEPVDVILIGDSFGAGIAVAQDEMFASLLRREHGVAVYNLAVPFFGPWEELLTLKAAYPELRTAPGATILWLLFTANDLDDRFETSLDVQRARSWLERARVRYRSFRRRSPVRQLLDRLALQLDVTQPNDSVQVGRLPSGHEMLYLRSYTARSPRSAAAVRAHPNYGPLRSVFGEMARFAGEHALRVSVVVAPSKEEIYPPDGASEQVDPRPSGFAEVAADLSREQGFAFLDLKPALLEAAAAAGYAPDQLLYWDDDTHWSAAGHAAVAEALLASGAVGGRAQPSPSEPTARLRR